jgi:hypothetical protein
MTRAEATTLGLQLLGGIGCSAGISAVLIALDAEEADALWAAGRFVGIGLAALIAAQARNDDQSGETKGRKSSP